MIKKHSQGLTILLAAIDLFVAAGSWSAAYLVRTEGTTFLPAVRGRPDPMLYLAVIPLVGLAILVSNRMVGLYHPRDRKGPGSEFVGVVKGTLLALVLLTAATFFQRGFEFSRWIVGFFGIIHVVTLAISRTLFWRGVHSLRRRGVNVTRALIVGSGRLGGRVVESIRKNDWAGIEIVGFLDEREERQGKTIMGVPVIGIPERVAWVAEEKKIDLVFVALPADAHRQAEDVVEALSDAVVDLRIVPDMTHFFTLNSEVSEFDGLPILSLRETPIYGWSRILKRAVDIAFSGAFILVFSPVYLFVALGVKLTSRGPVFYRQERTGLDGRKFDMLKFRSMRVDAEAQTGAVWAVENDPRRTRFGTFLRKSSLDEIPQFLNVLLGHMSVVGPRPERPVFIEQFRKSIPGYMLRHKMKAGITGWAQVNGWRGDTSLRKRIQYDLYYIEHWSFWFDVRIMFLTVFRGLVAPNAY